MSRTAAAVKNINGNRSMSGYPKLMSVSLMPVKWAPWNRKYEVGTATNRISGGWMTAVKVPVWRTASTAKMQPSAYAAADTKLSCLSPEPASNAKPTAVNVTASSAAPHHGTPGTLGCAERLSAVTADRVRCADTRRPYRLYIKVAVSALLACPSQSPRLWTL